jgi:site-specific DNA-methyltransferase (adenine-specific)
MRTSRQVKKRHPDGPNLFPEENGPPLPSADLDVVPQIDRDLIEKHPTSFRRGNVQITLGNALDLYDQWPAPVAIIADGPYGVAGFPGDPPTPEGLGDWYEPHVKKWSERSTPLTTLWFWNIEVGWANVHSVLAKYGWTYRGASVWDKGIAHLAGNINTGMIRRVPAVTELCVHYVKEARFPCDGRSLSMKEWLRHEWVRSGLPLSKTNEACGVKNAATRKYFTQCHLWYYPPVDLFVKLVEYANRHGRRSGKPYFSVDGQKPLTGLEWERMRAKFECEHGLTNVWREPAVRGQERLKNGSRAIHSNQKPLRLIELNVRLCTDPGDVVWEPFGGLCTATVACHHLGRDSYAAEIDPNFYKLAVSRLARYDHS